MLDGYLERHIHTMKKMYKKRRNVMTERFSTYSEQIFPFSAMMRECIYRLFSIHSPTPFFHGMTLLLTGFVLSLYRITESHPLAPPYNRYRDRIWKPVIRRNRGRITPTLLVCFLLQDTHLNI